MSALLVEDDAATRALLARQLRRSGLEVVAVESGERVLDELSDRYESFDVVILDVHLPGMSGLDLASLIQVRRPEQPIVLITGDSDPRIAREALARGPVSFLLKPFEMHELMAAVDQALARSATGRAGQKPDSRLETRGWLDLVEQSYMGSGHARRVGRLALALTESIPDASSRFEIGEMLVTAWSHELGRVDADLDAVTVAIEGAKVLAELGSAPGVVEAVRHLAERHDGGGGPAGLAGADIPLISQIVAIADAFEHFIMATMTATADPAEVVDRGLDLLDSQSGTLFRPELVEAARRQRARLITICADSVTLLGDAAPPNIASHAN